MGSGFSSSIEVLPSPFAETYSNVTTSVDSNNQINRTIVSNCTDMINFDKAVTEVDLQGWSDDIY